MDPLDLLRANNKRISSNKPVLLSEPRPAYPWYRGLVDDAMRRREPDFGVVSPERVPLALNNNPFQRASSLPIVAIELLL